MYKLVRNTDKIYKSTGGINTVVPKNTEFSVYHNGQPIVDIKDHFVNSEGIGNAIVKLLNDNYNKIKLILD